MKNHANGHWHAVALLGLTLASCGGSASGSDGQQSAIHEVCVAASDLPCATDIDTCEGSLHHNRAFAAKSACEAEFDAVITCLRAHPLVCSADGEAELSPECQPTSVAVKTCLDQSPGACAAVPHAEGTLCAIDCATWGATCSASGSELSCTCDPSHGTPATGSIPPFALASCAELTANVTACVP